MVHLSRSNETLDRTFAALADPTRREIVEQLGARGELSITSIAARFQISLTGAAKHVKVLEGADLVRSVKRGRTRTVALTGQSLEETRAWLETYGQMLDGRLDRLDELLKAQGEEKR